jgi:hypothetical protein
MAENKSSVSGETSYKKIGNYWDSHDLAEDTEETEFEVDLKSDVFYYPVEISLSSRIHSIAEEKGVSTEALVNLWLREMVNQEVSKH